jgi:L-iditol 2-dehydrogenase
LRPFGHRYAGTVAALGDEAPPLEPGQPVMGVHSAPCLACDLCRKERWHLCADVMKDKVLGAFGQYLCIPAAVARQNLFERPGAPVLSSKLGGLVTQATVSCAMTSFSCNTKWNGPD